MSGTARNAIVNGSAVGVNAAVNNTIENTQMRHGFKIVCPRRKPIKLRLIKNTGNSKATPKSKIILKTKSRYSSNLTRLLRASGVNPKSTLTAAGKIAYPRNAPAAKKGVTLSITASRGNSLIDIVVDGKRVTKGSIFQGDSKSFEANTSISIFFSNPAGLDVTVNGELLEPLGGQNQEVRRTFR
jgi:hypothetical protein